MWLRNMPVFHRSNGQMRDRQTRVVPTVSDCSLPPWRDLTSSVWNRSMIWCLPVALTHCVRGVEVGADLLSLDLEQDCVLPSWDSSSPEKPGQPYDEPTCVWWRIQHFPPAETKPQAPVWERHKASFTSRSGSWCHETEQWCVLQWTCAEEGCCRWLWGCCASTPRWSCRYSHTTRGGDVSGVCFPPWRWAPPSRGSGSNMSSPLDPDTRGGGSIQQKYLHRTVKILHYKLKFCI